MRERAFAVLADRVHDSRFLDLFAGTGAVGLEALSRGARSVVFVERHRAAVQLIEENSASFDLTTDRAELMVRGAAAAVDRLARSGGSFDIAWADPPFEAWIEGLEILVAAFDSGLLNATGLACLECPARADVESSLPENLRVIRDLTGGASRVVMIESRT
jgi:16S rRNA (guanine966-N2)-methyltransferase